MANDTTFALLPHIFKKLPFDHAKDLVPVGAFVFAPMSVVVKADSKFKTLGDLIAAAKAEADKVTYGTGGAGTTPHFVSEALGIAAGVNFLHIPFKGAGEADAGHVVGNDRLPGCLDARRDGQRQGRQGAPARGQRQQAARRRCPTCPPSPRPASRTSASSTSPGSGHRRARRKR